VTLVRFEGENLGYGGAPVLRDLALAVAAGERVVLLGRSGAGKSTLLNALRARVEAAGLRAALVPQENALVPTLSVFHNVYMGRLDRRSSLYNLATLVRPFRADRRAVAAVAEPLGLGGLTRRPVEALSGGQRQRVAVARALYGEGDVLLADEPVSALDEQQAPRVLASLVGAFRTSVVALHDVALARAHGTRLIGLRDGRIVLDAPAEAAPDGVIDALYAA
jgi:phosphonate transport system ATP-binding protein